MSFNLWYLGSDGCLLLPTAPSKFPSWFSFCKKQPKDSLLLSCSPCGRIQASRGLQPRKRQPIISINSVHLHANARYYLKCSCLSLLIPKKDFISRISHMISGIFVSYITAHVSKQKRTKPKQGYNTIFHVPKLTWHLKKKTKKKKENPNQRWIQGKDEQTPFL